MSQVHPEEIELARFSDGEAGVGGAGHLRWCARCRSVVADYRWLQDEITATLATAADAVPVPRPKWWVVQERLFASRRRQVTGGRISAVASVVLTVCLMLSLSPVLATAAIAQTARTLPPAAVVAPAPVTAVVSGGRMASVATPTPAISRDEVTSSPTPAFVLPPTPPEPET